MEIAAAMCIYTNDQIALFTLEDAAEAPTGERDAISELARESVGSAQGAEP